MQGSELYTVIFMILSVFVFFRMRSILGQRRGYEQKADQIYKYKNPKNANESINDNVVKLPQFDKKDPNEFLWEGYAQQGTDIASQLDKILKADPKFHIKEFMEGAKVGYDMIVSAFAAGDRKTLSKLIAKDVFEGFIAVVLEREANNQKAETKIIGFDEVKLVGANLKGKMAELTVEFNAKIVTFTKDSQGVLLEGSDKDIVTVKDIWTFAKDTTSKDPNWKLIETDEE